MVARLAAIPRVTVRSLQFEHSAFRPIYTEPTWPFGRIPQPDWAAMAPALRRIARENKVDAVALLIPLYSAMPLGNRIPSEPTHFGIKLTAAEMLGEKFPANVIFSAGVFLIDAKTGAPIKDIRLGYLAVPRSIPLPMSFWPRRPDQLSPADGRRCEDFSARARQWTRSFK